ncbi:hypothetical protein DFQ30_010861 [Apophysomyces sp. BC1015]|nr:hypothetical protein DFQ30_010861 [Apophysomyces sp. BC1015]
MESKPLGDLFKPIQNKSYLLETPCRHFATSFFMLTKQNIDPFIDNRNTNALDSLVTFAHFLTFGLQSIISIDPTVTKLYLVAMEMVKNDRKAENDKLGALRAICQVMQNQLRYYRLFPTTPTERKDTQK